MVPGFARAGFALKPRPVELSQIRAETRPVELSPDSRAVHKARRGMSATPRGAPKELNLAHLERGLRGVLDVDRRGGRLFQRDNETIVLMAGDSAAVRGQRERLPHPLPARVPGVPPDRGAARPPPRRLRVRAVRARARARAAAGGISGAGAGPSWASGAGSEPAGGAGGAGGAPAVGRVRAPRRVPARASCAYCFIDNLYLRAWDHGCTGS